MKGQVCKYSPDQHESHNTCEGGPSDDRIFSRYFCIKLERSGVSTCVVCCSLRAVSDVISRRDECKLRSYDRAVFRIEFYAIILAGRVLSYAI